MNFRPSHSSNPFAFTLVELLTVIAIIAILMGLLFPAISIAKEQARKTEAKTSCVAIVAAVKAYNTEYGKYPVGANTPSADLTYAAGADNSPLFNILRAIATTGTNYNPRGIVFFEGKNVNNPAAPKSGFQVSATSGTTAGFVGAFYDPWGNTYGVVMDANYDNQVVVPYLDFAATSTPPSNPQTGCVAFSMGKDGQLGTAGDNRYKSTTGTPSDDVISWQ